MHLELRYPAQSVAQLRQQTAHEMGHHLDYLWRMAPNPPGDLVSLSQKWVDLYEHDRFLLNFKWNGTTAQVRPACGSGGALVNLFDPILNQTVCNPTTGMLRSGYTGTNTQIVEKVLPGYFDRKTASVGIKANTTVVAGQVFTITFTNADLPGGVTSISYTAVAGDTNASVITALRNAINASTALQTVHITATTPGIKISADTAKPTYYSQSVIGAGAALTILSGGIGEFFAEEFVVVSGNRLTRSTDMTAWTRAAGSIEDFIASEYVCTKLLMQELNRVGAEPPGYSFNCTRPLPSTP